MIHANGFWVGEESSGQHMYDTTLSNALVTYFTQQAKFNEKVKFSVCDFGCGMGNYVEHLRKNKIIADGFDGNPNTAQLSKNVAQVIDLSEPFSLGRTYPWVMSLEVGEHLPSKFEDIFISNLVNHAKDGIILSWAVPGQGGHGHVNELPNNVIIERMGKLGWTYDNTDSQILRNAATFQHFKNTIMVFKR